MASAILSRAANGAENAISPPPSVKLATRLFASALEARPNADCVSPFGVGACGGMASPMTLGRISTARGDGGGLWETRVRTVPSSRCLGCRGACSPRSWACSAAVLPISGHGHVLRARGGLCVRAAPPPPHA